MVVERVGGSFDGFFGSYRTELLLCVPDGEVDSLFIIVTVVYDLVAVALLSCEKDTQ